LPLEVEFYTLGGMNMDSFEQFKELGWLSSAIALIVTFYKSSQKKVENYEELYFEKILLPYVEEYRKDKNINSITFFQDKNSLINCFIPNYVFSIIDKNDSILLHKILIVDYWEKHNSSLNNIYKKIDRLCNTTDFVGMFLFIFGSVISFLSAFLSLFIVVIDFFVLSKVDKDTKMFIVIGIIGAILFFVLIYFANKKLKNFKDDYTIKNEEIEKFIKNKEEEYNNNHIKYYIS
jgi:ABC-type multidrug transport system fused ATPase/permease subunit